MGFMNQLITGEHHTVDIGQNDITPLGLCDITILLTWCYYIVLINDSHMTMYTFNYHMIIVNMISPSL